jgi:RsiW-degrading membrane proteinase PrsW (M82 family)
METNTKERGVGPLIPEIIALLGGMLSGVLIALPLNTFIMPLIQQYMSDTKLGLLISLILVGGGIAPLTEEPFKVIGVIFLALLYPLAVITKKRGVILGGLAGLGFAFIENVIYFVNFSTTSAYLAAQYPGAAPEAFQLISAGVLTRAVLPILMHVGASAIVGLGVVYIAQHKFDRSALNISTISEQLRSKGFLSLLIIGMAMHFLYNVFGTLLKINFLPEQTVAFLVVILAYFLLSRIYHYLPQNLTTMKVVGPIELTLDSILARKRPGTDTSSVEDLYGPAVKYCKTCGADIKRKSSFCSKCGSKLKE